ncbi:FRAS1-related extracellular matrix protein 2-like [Amphiura filiformis]|uniref:FRAS1-related extracellular matrix protein 2-like n=1 Tax=Amphiura filiformis TaxID=82378 RepID=UPI003B21234C
MFNYLSDEFCFISEHIEVVEGADGDIILPLTVKRTGVLAAKTILYSTIDLTANSPDDFIPESLSNIVFGLGSDAETLELTIKCDGEVEGPEMFAVDLYHPTDPDPSVCTGKIGRPGRAFVTIHDHQKSLFSFEYHDYAVTEPLQGETEPVTVTVVRRGDIGRQSTIVLSLRDISTQDGLDYTPPSSLSVTFDEDETTKEVSIDINSDTLEEDPETFELSIDEVSDKNDVISKQCTTVVTINDRRRSCVEFAAPGDYSVLESSSEVSVTLWRSGNVKDAVQIGLTTADVDAKSEPGESGQDYNGLQSSPISFGPGQTSVTKTITIINDQIKETDECFQLSLRKLNYHDNVDICSTDATVFIKDDDDQFYFEGIFARVEEGQCTEVKILRWGYLDKESSVRVTVESSSADTTDYVIQPINSATALEFGINQDSRELQICATIDTLYEKDEQLSLVLQPYSGINNNGQIRYPDRVHVVILSNDQEPISCDPDCENGECAEGNNCVCQTGYAGYRCQTQIMCSPLQLANGKVVPLQNDYDVDSQVTCSCDTGYRLDGTSILTCKLDENVAIWPSSWSPQPPICVEEHEEIMCSPLQLANGKVVPLQNDYDVDSQVTCSCDTGYRLAGISTLTCRLVAKNVALWFPPPICVEEHEDNSTVLIGIILGGIALLGVLVGLPVIVILCFRNVINPRINPPKTQLQPQQQPQVQLMPYDGVNQYPFTGNAQTVAPPLMF